MDGAKDCGEKGDPVPFSLFMKTQLLEQARMLAIDEQIALAGAIWDGIVSRNAVPPLTEAQQTELDRRLANHLKNSDDFVSWDEVKAAALAKLRQ